MSKIKGYKAFDKDLKCRNFQYEIGGEYKEKGDISCYTNGFHFCNNPFDVLDYYPLIDDDGEFSRFAKVKGSGKIDRKGNKVCVSNIKVIEELKLGDFINNGVEFIQNQIKDLVDCESDDSGYAAQIGSSGDYAQIGSSGYAAKIGSSGYAAQIGSSGDYAKIGLSGDYAKIGLSGDYAKIGSSGYAAQIGSSGDYAQIGSSGDYAKIGLSGDYAQIGSSGDAAQIGSSGYAAKIGSSGYAAKIGSSGYAAKIGSSGDYAQINSSGNYSVIMCAGRESKARAKKGSWITLTEWEYDNEENTYIPICVKTEQVDGEIIKEDTYYKLKDGKFVEV